MREAIVASKLSIFNFLAALGFLFFGIHCCLAWLIIRVFDRDFEAESKRRNFWKFTDAGTWGVFNRARAYSWAVVSEKFAQSNYGVSRSVFRQKTNRLGALCCRLLLISFYLGLILVGCFFGIPSLIELAPPGILQSCGFVFALEFALMVMVNISFDAEWKNKEIDPQFHSKEGANFSPRQSAKKALRYITAATSDKAAQKLYGVSRLDFTGTRFLAKSMCWLFWIVSYVAAAMILWLFITDIVNEVFSLK